MKAKKVLAGVLSLTMILSLAACGSSDTETTAAADTTAAATEAADDTTEAADDTTEAAEGETAAGEGTVTIDEVDASDLEEVTLVLGSSASSTNEQYGIMEDLTNELNEKTDGKFSITLSWDGVLGSDAELAESCMGGNIDIISMATSPLLSYMPEVAVFDMPAVFEDADSAYEGINQFADTFQSVFNERGMQLLALGFSTFRGLSTNREITSPEDFQGMSIRVMENTYHTEFWTNMGASPTPMAFSELYLALQQGMVEAQDNPLTAVYASKFYEVQDYYMNVPIFPMVNVLAINKDTYDALPAEYQTALTQWAEAFMEQSYLQAEQIDANALEAMGDEITILECTDEIFQAFRTAAEPVWDSVREDIGDELPDAYLEAAGITQ